jgi:thiol-disulfide isomerase/thioredoxin
VTALSAAVCLTAAGAIFNLALTLGLARRLRLAALPDAAAGGASPPLPGFPMAGVPVSSFSAQTRSGVELSEADVSDGPMFVGFFSVGCEPCAALKRELLASDSPPQPFVAFIIGADDDPTTATLASELSSVAREVAVIDHGSSPVKAMQVEAYPTLLRLDGGVVQSSGWTMDAISGVRVG